MALKQYFYIVLVPLKFIPKRTASFWQTIKIPNRFVLKICTGGFADYICTNPLILQANLINITVRLHNYHKSPGSLLLFDKNRKPGLFSCF